MAANCPFAGMAAQERVRFHKLSCPHKTRRHMIQSKNYRGCRCNAILSPPVFCRMPAENSRCFAKNRLWRRYFIDDSEYLVESDCKNCRTSAVPRRLISDFSQITQPSRMYQESSFYAEPAEAVKVFPVMASFCRESRIPLRIRSSRNLEKGHYKDHPGNTLADDRQFFWRPPCQRASLHTRRAVPKASSFSLNCRQRRSRQLQHFTTCNGILQSR